MMLEDATLLEINITPPSIETTIRNPNAYADHAFKILKPAIANLRRFELENGLFPEYFYAHPDRIKAPEPKLSLEAAIEQIKSHPFINWINKQPGFIKAKEIIDKLGINAMGEPDSIAIKTYRNTFTLEFVVGTAIHYFLGEPHKTVQAVATKKKKRDITNAMIRLRHQLNLNGGLYFESESMQHILQYLLDSLLKNQPKNVYSEAVTHDNVNRHQLTKRIIQSLVTVYGLQNITEISVVDITLNIVSIFYTTMDRRGVYDDACAIFKHINRENSFKALTIGEIMAGEGLRNMTF